MTAKQKEALLEYMKENVQLQSSKFSASFTAKDAAKMWMALAEELHKIPNGATKDWKQWRKVSRREYIYNVECYFIHYDLELRYVKFNC